MISIVFDFWLKRGRLHFLYVNHGRSADTREGSHKYIELEFEGAKTNNDENGSSVGAYYFYKNIPAKEVNFDQINVVFKDKSSTVESDYSIHDLATVDSLQPIAMKFVSIYNTDSVVFLLDDRLKNDSTLPKVLSILHTVDSAMGKFTEITFAGFKFGKADSGEPVLRCWIRTETDKTFILFKITITLVGRKISGLAV